MDSLATWNCASYYSGTVSFSTTLKGSGVNQATSVTAVVTAGKVVCTIKSTEDGDFQGPGMIAVTPDGQEKSGEYEFSVWCPESSGKAVKRRDTPLIHIQDQQAADFKLLAGKDEYDSPNADEANGLTGKESITWDLRRK